VLRVKLPEHINWPDGLDAQQFLDEYWQKKPLLIRQAFVDFQTPISPDELAGLAIEEDTTPRLITQDKKGRYHLESGPFKESRFGDLDGNDWSLLVTDVEKHCPDLANYLKPFQFIPNWRIDDLMISYAPEGASVGAHVDEYDVFLLQASGTRQWMINSSSNPDLTIVPDATLKLLANFQANETHLLHPGDMLYLPPQVPHHGVAASDDCTTWSIGFRAPALADVIVEFADLIATKFEGVRYRDPALKLSSPGEIDQQTLQAFKDLWNKATQLSDEQLAQMTGSILSTPSVDTERETFEEKDVHQYAWQSHPFSRFGYVKSHGAATLFADGQAMTCSVSFALDICANGIFTATELNEDDLAVLQTLVLSGCMVPAD